MRYTGTIPRRLMVATLVLLASRTQVPADSPAPQVTVTVDHPMLVFHADDKGQSDTTATLTVVGVNFKPNHFSWAQVPDRINPNASKGTATFSVNDAIAPTTVVTFSDYGIYQIQVTASDGTTTIKQSTWINVWDNTPVLKNPAKLGNYPDITPPNPRVLSPDPGAFHHPRLLFTNADWPEMSNRAAHGAVAAAAVSSLREAVKNTLDDPESAIGKLAKALDQYAKSGYQDPAPDMSDTLSQGSQTADCMLDADPSKSLYGALLDACYLAWLDQDPSVMSASVSDDKQQRFQYLARLVAAAAKVHFDSLWDRKANTFNTSNPNFISGLDKPGNPIDIAKAPINLVLCYDLIYNWMDDAQRKDTRNFLYALSYARHFSNAFGTQGDNVGKPNSGLEQNGDFGNLNDYAILMALGIEGEEAQVSPEVQAAFGVPPADSPAKMWMQPSPADDLSAWPGSTVASVDNLQRQLRMLNEWFISPWGFSATNIAYLGLSTTHYLPPMLAYARRGENAFVTSTFYNGALAEFYTLEPGESDTTSPIAKSKIYDFDHHDGGRGRPTMYFIWKYMYPDDPMIDYVYRTFLPSQWRWGTRLDDPLLVAMFGLDPGVDGKIMPLEDIAAAKKLPLMKFDPSHSVALMRNSWKEDDLNLWYECGWEPYVGHMHAERNSFSLYALGRVWCCPPGYHCTINDLQSTVLIQDPNLADDPATQGYLGQSPSSVMQVPPKPGNFPTPPGKLLEVTEGPNDDWALFAGDATFSYTDGYHNDKPIDTGLKISSFMYPGLMENLNARSDIYTKAFDKDLMVTQTDFNPVQYAIRSVLVVRGERPFVLVVDDIKKDDNPHNYRWSMNGAMGFAPGQDGRFIGTEGHDVYSSLAVMPNATSTDAILYHSPIDDELSSGQAGLPRLLVRDVSEQDASSQPKMVLESRPPGVDGTPYLTYGYDNNRTEKVAINVPSNRLLIERDKVTEPKYKVLLFPYRTGEPLPITTWNSIHTQLTIDLQNGTVETLTFDSSNPDHRTRISVQKTKGPAAH